VIEVRTDKGQQVNRGDVLAVVVIPEAARAAAQLEGERLRQDAYRERLQHLERLRSEGLARGGDISETKARLRESEASALQAQALLATIEAIGLRRRGRVYEVSAPLAGVVTELRAARGAVHGPSDGPLLIVSGGEATRVEARFAFVPPPDLSYRLVVTGAPAAVLRFVARAPQLSAADATQLCWFELQAPVPLPPGTLVHVQIAPAADLWVVPRSALSATGATSLHLEGSGAHEVSVLATLGDQVLIRAQLTAEQRIRATAQVAAP
jgi:multidrug efflux pump subunit AcrA (membrane-fusion protein)